VRQEGHEADADADQPAEEQDPPILVLLSARDAGPGAEDAVHQRVGAEDHHQRGERDPRPEPGESSECDRNDAAQQQNPPGAGENHGKSIGNDAHGRLLLLVMAFDGSGVRA